MMFVHGTCMSYIYKTNTCEACASLKTLQSTFRFCLHIKNTYLKLFKQLITKKSKFQLNRNYLIS